MGSIGVDLDNTIVSYDEVFYRIAVERDLISPEVNSEKKAIRDAIRLIPNGEIEWQKLQAEIYGPRMPEAQLIPGVDALFQTCKQKCIDVFIVSHKTEHANYDLTYTNLRTAALQWLDSQGFFDPNVLGMSRERVFFESAREKKINRIKHLGCTVFIDDLEETYLEPSFPSEVQKILFDPHLRYKQRTGIRICSSWAEIYDFLFENQG